jgi:hypothetical protein
MRRKIDVPIPYLNVVRDASNKMADILNNCLIQYSYISIHVFLFSVYVLLSSPAPAKRLLKHLYIAASYVE